MDNNYRIYHTIFPNDKLCASYAVKNGQVNIVKGLEKTLRKILISLTLTGDIIKVRTLSKLEFS